MPETFCQKFREYSISYKFKYGKQQSKWAEIASWSEYISQRNYDFEYNLNAQDQTIHAEIEFKPRRTTLDPDDKALDLEDDQHFVIINITAEFKIHDLLMAKGDFLEPSKLDDRNLKAYSSDEENKVETRYSSPPLLLSLVESKPKNMKKIRFSISGRFSKKNPIKIVMHELVGNNGRNFIKETEPAIANMDK